MNLNYHPAANNSLSFLTGTKLFILLCGSTCYMLSLSQVAFFTSETDIHGYWVLMMGWMGVVIFQLSWFSNLFTVLGLLLLTRKPKTSLFISVIAVILATQSFQFSEIPIDLNHQKIYITELGLGFYLWFLSHCLFLLFIILENLFESEQAAFSQG